MALESQWRILVAAMLLVFERICCDVIVEPAGYTSYTQKHSASALNRFQVQFRTMEDTGILLHAKGGTDFITLELIGGKLRYGADLGYSFDSYGDVTSGYHELYVGQGLADNEWHNIVLVHNEEKRRVYINIDNLKQLEYKATRTIPSKVAKFGIEYVHVGGMKFSSKMSEKESLSKRGLKACFTNTTFNGKSVIDGDNVKLINAVKRDCPWKSYFNSIDFPAKEAYISYNYSDFGIAVKFGFRTKFVSQQLFYAYSTDQPYLQLNIESEGAVSATYGNKEVKSIATATHDGFWHEVELILSSSKPYTLQLVVDGQISRIEVQQPLKVKDKVLFGPKFIGCMKNVIFNGKRLVYSDFDKHAPRWSEDSEGLKPVFGKCILKDLCNPNPCLHGGECILKSYNISSCNCNNTGYTGSVCSKPLYSRSCTELKAKSNAGVKSGKNYLDVDGIGPLGKIEVECDFDTDTTIVNTKLSSNFSVENRYGMKRITVEYFADKKSLKSITDESEQCQQHVKYVCTKSTLFNSPKGPSKVRWIGPKDYYHYYWGGAAGKMDHCRCGVYSECTNKQKYCNCDDRSINEAVDEGFLKNKDHLPMWTIEFLDVNSEAGSKGRFSLGALRCSGDTSKGNAVSFRDSMAHLRIEPTSLTDYNNAMDALTVSFNFKTASAEGVLFYGKGRISVDYIMIRIVSKKRIRGEINLGSEADFVDVDVTGDFDDNKRHSVFLEFNRKEMTMTVDGVSKTTKRSPDSMTHLDLDGEPMFLGGGYGIAEGFSGCIFGLYINGKMTDIMSKAKYMEHYGVHAGCGIGCNRPSVSPCNYGKCIEEYSTFTCDCSLSSFDGRYCHKESYPVHFNGSSSLMYTFEKAVQIKKGEIVLAFRTTSADGLLFSMHDDKPNCHLSLYMQGGNLEVAFNFDTTSKVNQVIQVQSSNGNRKFDNDKLHHIRISHTPKKVVVEVLDGKPFQQMKAANSAGGLFVGVKISIGDVKPPLRSLIAGRYSSFSGCMSAFKYKYLANLTPEPILVNIFALRSKEDASVGGNAAFGACGKSLPTPPPLPKLVGRPKTSTFPKRPLPRLYRIHRDLSPIIIGVASGLAVILLIILLLFCKHINRNLGAYKTHEDKRPLAAEAETSFIPNQDSTDGQNEEDNGTNSEKKGGKKREWFV